MNKGKRRWWLIVLVAVVVVAAAVTAGVLLLGRGKSGGVHYLTSTAATGTIAETVQADFTLAGARDVMTISLGGTGSSSSGSGTTVAAATTAATASAVTKGSAVTTMRAVFTNGARTASTTTAATTLADVAVPAITALIPTSAPVDGTVTIVGSGFTGATVVAFNGVVAHFTVNSDTQITTTVPAGATNGPIAVTAPGGVATSAASFTVAPAPKKSSTPKPTPKPSSTRSSSGGGSGSSGGGNSSTSSASRSASSSSSSSTGTSSTGSSSSTSASSSAASSEVVTGIPFAAGRAPSTLAHLLTLSGKPIYAFVSPSPLYTTLSTSLASGAQRSNVATLQRALKSAGYFTGTVNGDFGATTQTALEDWQGARGLTKTGQVTTSQFIWVPQGATIESWSVSLGGSVSTSTALATVDYPRDLVAQALVTQANVSSLKVGQKAALTIDGATNDPFTATITSISSQPASSSSSGGSSSTVEYTVDLAPHGLPDLAKSGMTGSLVVTIASRSNVLVVPTSAVSGSSSASFVRVMLNGTPTYRQVTTGMATSSLTQITSGLAAGEVVVTGQYTNSATTNSSTGSGLGGLGGFGNFGGGGGFRRSTGGSPTGAGGQ
jgi:Putative peptidoglycan binding domain/HlyD family secretion protein